MLLSRTVRLYILTYSSLLRPSPLPAPSPALGFWACAVESYTSCHVCMKLKENSTTRTHLNQMTMLWKPGGMKTSRRLMHGCDVLQPRENTKLEEHAERDPRSRFVCLWVLFFLPWQKCSCYLLPTPLIHTNAWDCYNWTGPSNVTDRKSTRLNSSHL